MLLIFISWIYIFYAATVWGITFNSLFKLKENNYLITQILGLFSITIITAISCFFTSINIGFYIVFFLASLLLAYFKRKQLKIYITHLKIRFFNLSKPLQIAFFIFSWLCLAQASTLPYIIDNESYYLQTIKWLNEYGFVKGLSNLHLFFAQTSGWHILQSAFNFSFLTNKLNDLSAYIYFLVAFYSFEKINLIFKEKSIQIAHYFIAIVPLVSVLFFQFISSPSPDIPVFLFSFLIFYKLLKNWNNLSITDFKNITFICFFILLIKISSVYIVCIPIILLAANYQKFKTSLVTLVSVGLFVLAIFIGKNQWLTGYPLFPLQNFKWLTSDYSIPEAYQSFFFKTNKVYAYKISYLEYQELSILQRLKVWLSLPKLHGVFNKLILGLIIVFPFFIILKKKIYQPLLAIYSLACIQLAVLFITSPQYRFFLVFILTLVALLTFIIFQNKILIKIALPLSLIITSFILLFPFKLDSFTTNKFTQNNSSFKLSYIIFPHKNSKYNYTYHKEKIGNLKYNNPTNQEFFWITGDGDLPVIKKEQLEYFKNKYHYYPQLRTGKLKDGFYSKSIDND